MEYTAGAGSWRQASHRVLRALRRRSRPPRRGWSVLVPVTAFAAGLLFTTSATTARGTELRTDRNTELATLIQQRRQELARAQAQAGALRREIDDQTSALAGTDGDVAAQQRRGDAVAAAAGLTAAHGPGLVVRLNDAPRRPDGALPPGAQPDDLVVHQQDVQAVVNALWTGGAEAVTIMGVRLISTSAVRCVGNTLLLDGRLYSPPFVITAIGDADAMRTALNQSPEVAAFQQAADAFGLGYDVATVKDVTVPAYDGSTALRYARVTG